MLEYYYCRRAHLSEFCLYAYFATILIVKCAKSCEQVFELKESYPHKSDLIQKHHTKPDSDFLVTLIGNLSQCQFEKDAILGDYPDTILQQNTLAEILLALFIP